MLQIAVGVVQDADAELMPNRHHAVHNTFLDIVRQR